MNKIYIVLIMALMLFMLPLSVSAFDTNLVAYYPMDYNNFYGATSNQTLDYNFLDWSTSAVTDRNETSFTTSGTGYVRALNSQLVGQINANSYYVVHIAGDINNGDLYITPRPLNPTYKVINTGTFDEYLTIYWKDSTMLGGISLITSLAAQVNITSLEFYPITVQDVTNNYSGAGINMDYSNITTGQYGDTNGALNFNGTNEYVQMGQIYLNNGFTYCAWIKPDSFSNRTLFGDAKSNQRLIITDTDSLALITDSAGRVLDLDINLTTDWQYLCVTRGDSTFILDAYINGVSAYSTGDSLIGNINIGYLGQRQGITFYDGAMSDVRFYDKKLNSQEINALYNEQALNYNLTNPEYDNDQNLLVVGHDYNWNVADTNGVYPTTNESLYFYDFGRSDSNSFDGTTDYWIGDSNNNYPTNILGYYPLSQFDSNGNILYDVILNNNGTSTNTPVFGNNYFGDVNSAMTFNGTTDLVNTNTDWIKTNAVTISAWIYLDSYGGNNQGRIIDNGETILWVDTANDNLMFTSNNSQSTMSATNSILTGQWYHIAVTRTNTAPSLANFYINGVLSGSANQNSGTDGIDPGTTNVIIGNRNAGSRTFDGMISNLMVLPYVASQDEIYTLYNTRKLNVPANYTDFNLSHTITEDDISADQFSFLRLHKYVDGSYITSFTSWTDDTRDYNYTTTTQTIENPDSIVYVGSAYDWNAGFQDVGNDSSYDYNYSFGFNTTNIINGSEVYVDTNEVLSYSSTDLNYYTLPYTIQVSDDNKTYYSFFTIHRYLDNNIVDTKTVWSDDTFTVYNDVSGSLYNPADTNLFTYENYDWNFYFQDIEYPTNTRTYKYDFGYNTVASLNGDQNIIYNNLDLNVTSDANTLYPIENSFDVNWVGFEGYTFVTVRIYQDGNLFSTNTYWTSNTIDVFNNMSGILTNPAAILYTYQNYLFGFNWRFSIVDYTWDENRSYDYNFGIADINYIDGTENIILQDQVLDLNSTNLTNFDINTTIPEMYAGLTDWYSYVSINIYDNNVFIGNFTTFSSSTFILRQLQCILPLNSCDSGDEVTQAGFCEYQVFIPAGANSISITPIRGGSAISSRVVEPEMFFDANGDVFPIWVDASNLPLTLLCSLNIDQNSIFVERYELGISDDYGLSIDKAYTELTYDDTEVQWLGYGLIFIGIFLFFFIVVKSYNG